MNILCLLCKWNMYFSKNIKYLHDNAEQCLPCFGRIKKDYILT